MLLTKSVFINWNNKHKRYYEDLGYKFTKTGDSFEVLVEHLAPSSHAEVDVLCDFCKETVVKKKYQTYVKQHHPQYGDCCQKCQPLKNKLCCLDKYGVDNGSKIPETIKKIKDVSMEKYGVDNPSKAQFVRDKISEKSKQNAPMVREKINQTNLERYGTTNLMSLDWMQDKIKSTMFEKYGVYHPKQSEEIKEKERQHNLEKYGVEYVAQIPEVREKMKATCLERYGVECSLSSDVVREKITRTLAENGNVWTSKPQIAVYDMLLKEYGNCELNYSCGRCSLDCMVIVDNIMIDVEYDGAYWHKDKKRDRARDEYVKSRGYKVFRMIGGKEIPTIEQIRECINFLTTTDYKFTRISLV